MKSNAEQNWFDDLINDFVPNVPKCPHIPKRLRGQNETTETRMDKGICNPVPNVPIVPTKKGNAEKINSITSHQEAVLKNWLTEIGESESEHYLVLNKCRKDCEARNYFLKLAAQHAREKRRQKVIKMLADNPDIQRAFIADAESNKDNVILTMVIRDKYSFEMLIPKTKYDAFNILAAIQNLGMQ